MGWLFDNCFTSQEKYKVQISWQAKLFVILSILETLTLYALTIVLTKEAFDTKPQTSDADDETRSARFNNIVSFFIFTFFLYEACRAIDKESKVELGIAVSLSGLIAIWLTSHVVSPYKYERELFNIIGRTIAIVAWAAFGVYLPLAWFASDKFGYRTWNKVGGLAQNQALYQATAEFRALLRLDMFTVLLACASAMFYVVKWTGGLIACIIFLVWSWIKNMWTRYAVRRGWMNQVRIFLFTTVDIVVAFGLTVLYNYIWRDSSNTISNMFWIYFCVGLATLATRASVFIFGRRAMEEMEMLRFQRPFVASGPSSNSAFSNADAE